MSFLRLCRLSLVCDPDFLAGAIVLSVFQYADQHASLESM